MYIYIYTYLFMYTTYTCVEYVFPVGLADHVGAVAVRADVLVDLRVLV